MEQTERDERKGEEGSPENQGRREYQYYQGQRSKRGLEHIGKKPVMVVLVIGILLIAVGSTWISSAKVPNYKKYHDEDIEDRNDYREDWSKGLYTATKFGSIIAIVGCLLNSIVAISVGVVSEELEKEEKYGFIIIGSLFALGMIFIMNHVFTYAV